MRGAAHNRTVHCVCSRNEILQAAGGRQGKGTRHSRAPVGEMRQIVDFTIKNDEQFVRVFSSELGNKEGAWMMKAADVAGMTPGQIKDKYALDYVPDMMVDVTVAGGSTLRAGTAATREGICAGGGTQFMATGRLSSESFTNERALGQ